ncbi:ankyrin repeat and sterile alpha motif domain-containing protein 1B isoform X3 [Cotesia glomerata]|uniref:ankyrin repeat and sterile alpha motif domain-containing protein 1B isoform X3 n=1 Tax=Cotesia glomerata TaxID=32391 RepID=UPI001D0083EC|nr:ankyrin repeat and sterile alpha motif domain-containing protein 1B isoform X3 [Cotesia glomerata]
MGKDQELLEAARSGNVTIVEKILGQRARRSGPLASLRRGPGANVQDASGYSALHHAALNGHKDVVKLLLQHEASTNVVDAKGSSPLHLAAWAGDAEIVRLILSQGPSVPNVNLTTKDNETALHCAAQYGHTEVVAQLLQYGCDPSIRNSRGESALDLAAQYGRLETVQLIVRTHPELIEPLRNSSSSLIFPHTPLHLASRNGHRAVVEVLLASGVDVNTRTSAGTAMHEAALCGKMEVVRTLLDRGVDLGIRDARHNTVLDLLGQFPPHVTHDITAVIKRHRSSSGVESDADSEHIPRTNDILGSPYDNALDLSPVEGSSPTQWQFYHKPRDEDRRVSGTSVMSFGDFEGNIYYDAPELQMTESYSDPSSFFDSVLMSMSDTLNSINTLASSVQTTPDDNNKFIDIFINNNNNNNNNNNTSVSPRTRGSDSGLYQTPPAPRYTEGSYVSEDLSLTLPAGFTGRESDQLSVSSSSSIGGPSPRDRRCLPNDSGISGIYLPMAPLSSSLHSPASNSKVSPTPPKKPPRRNLSVSPTHLQTQMSLSADCSLGPSNYEYLFLARSGARSHIDLEQLQTRRDQLRHVTRSVDQYVDMKARYSGPESTNRRAGEEPVALTAVYGDRLIKLQNPRRKLRRHCERAYENYDVEDNNPPVDQSPTNETLHDQTFVSNAFLTLKSSQESLLDDRTENGDTTPQEPQTAGGTGEATDKRLKRVQMLIPTSPTHYIQPPTPDHPPPSALQAEKSIHERIRPLSQIYKRRSRDMETETEEDLLQFQPSGSLDASSGSLSSVSLSDKSMSTDNVEEYFGDVPFAVANMDVPNHGHSLDSLLKGSVTAERPRTLRRLRNVYTGNSGMGTGSTDSSNERIIDNANADPLLREKDRDREEKSLSIMSPFDEQEEWAKISEIMASFGTGLVRESVFVNELEKEFQSRLGIGCETNSPTVTTTIGQWLLNLGFADYESLFLNYGFDDLEFINGVLEESDLKDMGITSDTERAVIMNASLSLNKRVDKRSGSQARTVEEWLKGINLDNYLETFKKHLYTDMDRVKRVWEVELAAVLEIQKPGHRKRILASVTGPTPRSKALATNGRPSNLDDINKDLNNLLKEEIRDKLPETQNSQNNGNPPVTQNSSTTVVTGTNAVTTGTLRHRKNRPAPQPPHPPHRPENGTPSAEQLEIRAPSELLFGVPSTLKTQWRHQPKVLVTSNITYVANYLGSTVVKELRGTESTKKSIQKLKNTCRDPRVSLAITLAISYRGVRFLDTNTNEPICDHEIRNINCACQDADDLTHFAYITKDHASRTHFCHVFCVSTMDQATEVILTLGQAFEVAYQMALKDKLTGTGNGNSQTVRSQSASQLTNITHTQVNVNSSKTPNGNNNQSNDTCANDKNSTPTLTTQINKNNSNSITATINISSSSSSSSSSNSNSNSNNGNSSNSNTLKAKFKINKTSTNVNTNSNSNSHCNVNMITNSHAGINVTVGSNCTSSGNSNANTKGGPVPVPPKPLVTHGRSHSVNDIKINGNQLKLVPTPVDDIGIGVKDMKAGSRAPIALSEEL